MPLHVCEPGQWYLVVTCKGCGTRGPILHDLSEGQSKIMAVYTWRCPMCDHIDQYDEDDIERYSIPSIPRPEIVAKTYISNRSDLWWCGCLGSVALGGVFARGRQGR